MLHLVLDQHDLRPLLEGVVAGAQVQFGVEGSPDAEQLVAALLYAPQLVAVRTVLAGLHDRVALPQLLALYGRGQVGLQTFENVEILGLLQHPPLVKEPVPAGLCQRSALLLPALADFQHVAGVLAADDHRVDDAEVVDCAYDGPPALGVGGFESPALQLVAEVEEVDGRGVLLDPDLVRVGCGPFNFEHLGGFVVRVVEFDAFVLGGLHHHARSAVGDVVDAVQVGRFEHPERFHVLVVDRLEERQLLVHVVRVVVPNGLPLRFVLQVVVKSGVYHSYHLKVEII